MEQQLNEKIPKNLYHKILGQVQLEENIIYYARTDMDLEGHYAEGFVILTLRHLIIASSPPNMTSVHTFGGYSHTEDTQCKESQNINWEINSLELSKIEKLEIQMLVSGGLLYGVQSSDKLEFRIAGFSNSCMGEMKRLIKLFSKVRDDLELTEKDFEDKKKEENCPKCGTRYPNKDRNICPKCMDKRSVFFRMMSYYTPHKVKIGIMILCYIGTALLNLAWPY